MYRRILTAIALAAIFQWSGYAADNPPIGEITIAPLFYKPFACAQHPNGQLSDPGDALGSDCFVLGGLGGPSGFMRLFKTDGVENEDWYGWHVEVHAPFDGVVTEVAINRVTNKPGTEGKPPPGYIKFQRTDGAVVVYVHLDDIRVRPGDRVSVGQVVAIDGNNGFARMPHVHVGAYLGKTPMQIRWDLAAEGRIQTLTHPQQPGH